MFPTRIEELTTQWLTETLETRGVAKGRKVIRVKPKPAPSQGRTSVVYLLDLEYEGANPPGPTKLVLKLPAPRSPVADVLRSQPAFGREVFFYRNLSEQAGIDTPVCYAAEYDEATADFVLLLEYVAHAPQPDVSQGTAEQVAGAIEHLAALHARWLRREDALQREGLPLHLGTEQMERHQGHASRALIKLPDVVRSNLGSTALEVLTLWRDHLPAIARWWGRGPLTLCHGSLHRQQILFPMHEGDRFCIIDWQSATIDCGPVDVARLVVTGLTPTLRRQHEQELLAAYVASLTAQGVEGYAHERLLDDYRFAIARTLVSHASIFAMFSAEAIVKNLGDPSDPLSLFSHLFTWVTWAIEDNDVLDLMHRISE